MRKSILVAILFSFAALAQLPTLRVCTASGPGNTITIVQCAAPLPGPVGPIGPVGPGGPPGPAGTVAGLPLTAMTGALDPSGNAIPVFPANSLAICVSIAPNGTCPSGLYTPVFVVNSAPLTASIPQMTPVNATPAVAAFVNLTDPTGKPADFTVALFSYYTAFPNAAVWNPVNLALFGNGIPSAP